MKHLSSALILALNAFLLVLTLPTEGWSANFIKCAEAPQPMKQISIYFGNGVDNTYEDAYNNQQTLEYMMMGEVNPPAETCVNWKLAINPTAWLIDFIEVFVQRLQLSPTEVWRALINPEKYLPPSKYTIFVQLLAELEGKVLTSLVVDTSAIQQHADMYRADINNSCQSVLVVAHSQGNLYANQAYERLTTQAPPIPPNTFKIVGVAVPDNAVHGGGVYATAETDVVINIVRTFFPNTLPGMKEANWGPSGDFYGKALNHAFAGYANADSRKFLAKLIENSLNSLTGSSCPHFSQPTYVALPSWTTVDIKIVRANTTTFDQVTVTTDGKGSAQPNVDYTPMDETVDFPVGVGEKTVQLRINRGVSPSTTILTVPLLLKRTSGSTGLSGTTSAEVEIFPEVTGQCFYEDDLTTSHFINCAYAIDERAATGYTGGTATLTGKTTSDSIMAYAKAYQPEDSLGAKVIVIQGQGGGSSYYTCYFPVECTPESVVPEPLSARADIIGQYFAIHDPDKTGTTGHANLVLEIDMSGSAYAASVVGTGPADLGGRHESPRFSFNSDNLPSGIQRIPFDFEYSLPMRFSIEGVVGPGNIVCTSTVTPDGKDDGGATESGSCSGWSGSLSVSILGIEIEGGAGPNMDITVGRDAVPVISTSGPVPEGYGKFP